MKPTPIVYTVQEVADALKVTKRTILEYIYNGKIKAVKIGREWRITADALNNFLDAGTDPTNEKAQKTAQKREATKKKNAAAQTSTPADDTNK